MKEWYVLTVEHRRYQVKAETKKQALDYLRNEADLRPKDKNVELTNMDDFEIVQ